MKSKTKQRVKGLVVRWAFVPFLEHPDQIKKRPVVVLKDDKKQHKSMILRITSKFNSKSSYEKFCRFRIGKMNPFKKNGLIKPSFVDLSEAQIISDSLFLKHGFVGCLNVYVSLKLVQAGYKYQVRYRNHFSPVIKNLQAKINNSDYDARLHNFSYTNPLFFYGHNLTLTPNQKKANMKNVSYNIHKIKLLNDWKNKKH